MKSLIIVAILCIVQFGLSSQNLSVQYEISLHLSEMLPNVDQKTLEKFENNIEVYQYDYRNQKSQYLYLTSKKRNPNISGAKFKAVKTSVWKDFENGLLLKRNVSQPDIVSSENFKQINWTINEKETKSIAGYLCQQAVLGGQEPLTVWFAPDIPVSDGPMDYYGLPGLILEMEMKIMTIRASEISFPEEMADIELPSSGNFVSPEEFQKNINANGNK